MNLFIKSIMILFLVPISLYAQNKNRLEEFLIWKMSDELKLSAKEEQTFSKVIRDINQKKNKLSGELEAQFKKLSEATTPSERSKQLIKYRTALISFNNVATEEFDLIQKNLGDQRTIAYLAIKKDLGEKLKTVLTNSEVEKSKTEAPVSLPEPKIIREKK